MKLLKAYPKYLHFVFYRESQINFIIYFFITVIIYYTSRRAMFALLVRPSGIPILKNKIKNRIPRF